jgi:hydroxymethylbilane synthase
MTTTLRIATRKSALAMWQANHVSALLEEAWPGINIELVPIVTQGDRILDRPLAEIGGKGLFLKELERAMLDGEADLAVHSMKDVPAESADGLVLDAVLPRATPFDAFVCNRVANLDELPPGSLVGTSSLRRQCQLLSSRPDLRVADLRGNVDTRLRKLDEEQYDAIILASAGLERLGWGERIAEQLKPPHWLPASTQGIICLQCREDDDTVLAHLRPLNDPETAIQARAERTVARKLEGSCQLPLAVFAELSEELLVRAMVGMPDGSSMIQARVSGNPEQPETLGLQLAEKLFSKGAGDIISQLKAN